MELVLLLTSKPHRRCTWWAGQDSNLRKGVNPTDLQSVAFDHSATYPKFAVARGIEPLFEPVSVLPLDDTTEKLLSHKVLSTPQARLELTSNFQKYQSGNTSEALTLCGVVDTGGI